MYSKVHYIIGDLLMLILAFIITIWIKSGYVLKTVSNYFWLFATFILLWVITSLLIGKYNLLKQAFGAKAIFRAILFSNTIILGVIAIIVYFLHLFYLSRFVILNTIVIATIFEIAVTMLFYFNKSLTKRAKEYETREDEINSGSQYIFKERESISQKTECLTQQESEKDKKLRNLIIEESGEEVYRFIYTHTVLSDPLSAVISTTTRFNILNLPDTYNTLINLKKINDIQYINKFFEEVNGKLNQGALFIGFAETSEHRKRCIYAKYRWFARFYYFGDFILHRVLPKLSLTKNLYFRVTRGTNRVVSKAETLGRLVSCGFEIKEYNEGSKLLFFAAQKVGEPSFDMNPSYGPLFKMRRIGKNWNPIYVYKFRTMHPYAEYLQDYILKMNGYSDVGKPAEDFRVTSWGKFFRKYWLDELPQLINVFKGEMKIVGIRPISDRFLKEFPEDLLKLRFKHKPGCIPPYVALRKQGVSAYIESDRIYLLALEKHPYTTDIKYFTKAIYNILFNKIRSA